MMMIEENETYKLLLVDDAPTNLKLLMNAFEDSGYELFLATNGRSALDIAKTERPDLVLLDIMMPEMNGYEVCERLIADKRTAEIPIIFITAKSEVEDETVGLSLGAVDYITKPFNASVVLARVKTHLALMSVRRTLSGLNQRLMVEREIVEDIVTNAQQSNLLDTANIRHVIKPLEKASGDIFLAAFRPDGAQHVMLGDFTGHGLVAAVGSPLVSDTFYNRTLLGDPMQPIVADLNEKLFRILRNDMFMVACCLEMNASRTELAIWNCGLNEVFIFRDGELYDKISSTHFPRGLLDRPDEEPRRVQTQKGDRIFIYSDGAIEERDPAGELFNMDRLQGLLQDIVSKDLSLDIILEELDRFREGVPQKDDITLAELTC